MFYNYSLVGYFVLLFVAFVAVFNGLTIMKIERLTFTVPFGSEQHVVEGKAAVYAGTALIVLGVISFMVFVWLLIG